MTLPAAPPTPTPTATLTRTMNDNNKNSNNLKQQQQLLYHQMMMKQRNSSRPVSDDNNSHHHHDHRWLKNGDEISSEQQKMDEKIPFWFGHEDEPQIEFVLKQYSKHLRLDIYSTSEKPFISPTSSHQSQQQCAIRPKQFIGKVVRRRITNFSDTKENSSFVTQDTLYLFYRDKGRSPDHLMAFAKCIHLRTEWDVHDGTPLHFEHVQPSPKSSPRHDSAWPPKNEKLEKLQEETLQEKKLQEERVMVVNTLYCLPVFGSRIDDDFRYFSVLDHNGHSTKSSSTVASRGSVCDDICSNRVTYSDLMSQAAFKQRNKVKFILKQLLMMEMSTTTTSSQSSSSVPPSSPLPSAVMDDNSNGSGGGGGGEWNVMQAAMMNMMMMEDDGGDETAISAAVSPPLSFYEDEYEYEYEEEEDEDDFYDDDDDSGDERQDDNDDGDDDMSSYHVNIEYFSSNNLFHCTGFITSGDQNKNKNKNGKNCNDKNNGAGTPLNHGHHLHNPFQFEAIIEFCNGDDEEDEDDDDDWNGDENDEGEDEDDDDSQGWDDDTEDEDEDSDSVSTDDDDEFCSDSDEEEEN